MENQKHNQKVTHESKNVACLWESFFFFCMQSFTFTIDFFQSAHSGLYSETVVSQKTAVSCQYDLQFGFKLGNFCNSMQNVHGCQRLYG